MQVSQTEDFITHAQIGKGKVQSFEIAQTAEFFQVLSSSLYSNKKLAVIREVLCNAWDAHIAAGCTSTPIEITLTDDHLIIRDFGHGIDPTQIIPIYGTYGASTKLHDGKQTGGFGLGCKAPFAYTDHFEVTSFHGGTKTIYAMSLSSPELGGLPAITTIMTLPTTETGLQVKIGLKTPHDKRDFDRLIRKVALHGEMNAILHGEPLDTFTYSACTHGFAVVAGHMLDHGLHVRYGNVVYKIGEHDDYSEEFTWFNRFLNQAYAGSYFGDKALVLLAEPHTIAVTPSRESLSMTDRTVATIKAMLVTVRKAIEAETRGLAVKLLNQGIEAFWQLGHFGKLFEFTADFPGKVGRRVEIYQPTPADLARSHIHGYYRNSRELQKLDILLRLEALIRSGQDRTGLARSLRKAIKHRGLHCDTGWFHQAITQRLSKALYKAPLLDPKRLLVLHAIYDSSATFLGPNQVNHYTHKHYLPFVRGFVILSYNRTDAWTRAVEHPAIKHHFGPADRSLLYTVQRKPEHVEAAREFFAKRGFYIIDLTKRHSWDAPTVSVERAKPKPKLERQPGFAAIVGLDNRHRWACHLSPEDLAQFPGSDEPAFYVMDTDSSVVVDGCRPWRGQLAEINQLYGQRGVVALTPAQRDKLTKAKVPALKDWLPQQLIREFKADSTLRREWISSADRKSIHGQAWDLVRRIRMDRVLGPKFKLNVELEEHHKLILRLVEHVLDATEFGKDLRSYLDGLKPNPNLTRLLRQIEASETLVFLNSYSITQHLGGNRDSKLANKARKLILFALKG